VQRQDTRRSEQVATDVTLAKAQHTACIDRCWRALNSHTFSPPTVIKWQLHLPIAARPSQTTSQVVPVCLETDNDIYQKPAKQPVMYTAIIKFFVVYCCMNIYNFIHSWQSISL